MRIRNRLWVPAGFILILALGSSSQAVQAGGQVKVSDDNGELDVKLKVTLDKEKNQVSGFFQYSNSNKKVFIKAKYLKIDGDYAWFAGQCAENSSEQAGRWFFAAVHDGGEPGRLVDQIWWEWIAHSDNAESTAKRKVLNMDVPSERKEIISGNIEVSD